MKQMNNTGNEGFNAEAAKSAVQQAAAEIENLIKNFQATSSHVEENLGANVASTSAMGGNLGSSAQSAFSENNEASFSDVHAKIDNFINYRVENIIKENVKMTDSASAIYKG